jgi:hypothetical protein
MSRGCIIAGRVVHGDYSTGEKGQRLSSERSVIIDQIEVRETALFFTKFDPATTFWTSPKTETPKNTVSENRNGETTAHSFMTAVGRSWIVARCVPP